MPFLDTLRAENDARREQLRAEESARDDSEQQKVREEAAQTVQDVIDTLVREAENGEILAFPQNITMKYDPERTLWIRSLQDCAKEAGISLVIDYNFGIMEFVADPREPDCVPLHDAFLALTEDIAAHYADDAAGIMEYVKTEMLRTVQNGNGNEERVTVMVRLLEITPDADNQPNLFANWKSSLEYLQYIQSDDLLAGLKDVKTAAELQTVFSTDGSRTLREHQSLKKMIYALWLQAQESGLTMIPAGEWMPFANMTAGILLFSTDL